MGLKIIAVEKITPESIARDLMNEENEEQEQRAPTMQELAQSASNFISAKNYDKGKKVSFKIEAYDRMQRSEKFGTWNALYDVRVVGHEEEMKKYGLPGKIADALMKEYGIKDYPDLIGKVLTLLVVKASSGVHTFELVDCK